MTPEEENPIYDLPEELLTDPGDTDVLTAAVGTPATYEINQARRRARERIAAQYQDSQLKFSPDTQPRDTSGKFRDVLARLKMNLGEKETETIASELEKATAAGSIGDFVKAKEAAANILSMIDKVESGALDRGGVKNIRNGSRELGRLMAYLPMPQGDTSAKIRFSDLPGPSAKLIEDLVKRVKTRLDTEDQEKYIGVLQSFMSGVRTMSADEMSQELARILRALS